MTNFSTTQEVEARFFEEHVHLASPDITLEKCFYFPAHGFLEWLSAESQSAVNCGKCIEWANEQVALLNEQVALLRALLKGTIA